MLLGPNDSYAVVLGNDNTVKIVRLPFGGAAQTEAFKLDATGAATFAGPVTFLSGGAFAAAGTVNLSGPVNISTGPLTVVTSGVVVTAGGLTLTAGAVNGTPSPATTSGTAIPSAAGVITVGSLVMRVTNSTAAVTSAAITTGLNDGQMLIIINNGTVPISFATQATSNIAVAGTTLTVLNQKQSRFFVWSAIDALWYPAIATAI